MWWCRCCWRRRTLLPEGLSQGEKSWNDLEHHGPVNHTYLLGHTQLFVLFGAMGVDFCVLFPVLFWHVCFTFLFCLIPCVFTFPVLITCLRPNGFHLCLLIVHVCVPLTPPPLSVVCLCSVLMLLHVPRCFLPFSDVPWMWITCVSCGFVSLEVCLMLVWFSGCSLYQACL